MSVLHGQPWKNGGHCDQAPRNVSSLVQPGSKLQGQRSISRSKMIFQPIKVETSVKPHFRVIFTEKFISYIIFMFQGHSQGQKINFKVNHIKNVVFFK